MAWPVAGLLLALILGVILVSGIWVAFALGAVGLIGLLLAGIHWTDLTTIGSIAWNNVNSFTLLPLPLFILMGEIMLKTRFSERFYRGMSMLLQGVPGGLLQSNVATCSLFAAISGSSTATAATIGTVAIPELVRRGYNRELIGGSIAAAGTLGILIPPSAAMILYAVLVSESVAKLFIAGVVPGILMALAFMLYIGVRAWLNPAVAPVREEEASARPTAGQRLRALLDVAPVLIVILVILGGIYSGVMTATEASAAGVLLVALITLFYREMRLDALWKAVLGATRVSSSLLFIVIGAQIISFALLRLRITDGITAWLTGLHVTPTELFALVFLIYVVLGCLIDSISMIFLTLPLIAPVVRAFGFDMVWFGIIVVILIEMGQVTPPVGINLFVLQGISRELDIGQLIRGVLPFVLILAAGAWVVYYLPGLALWLPGLMHG